MMPTAQTLHHATATTTNDVYASRAAARSPVVPDWDAADRITTPVFDQAGLLHRVMGDEPLARRVAETFLDDIPRQIHRLKNYLDAGEVTSATIQVHCIIGAAATVGGERVRAAAIGLERAVATGDAVAVRAGLGSLERSFEALQVVIVCGFLARPERLGLTSAA